MYRVAMTVSRPVVRTWGRLEDPVAVGVAAIRRRQIKALAKSTLWDMRGLAPVLNGMGQIPIERGAGDVGALSRRRGVARWRLHRRFPGRNPLAR